jgi:hypothetical protein
MFEKSVSPSVLFIIFLWCVMPSDGQIHYCKKFNFNQKAFSGFGKCQNNAGEFMIKDYEVSELVKQFTPYTTSSEYYLSPSREGLICAETKDIFKLNASSEIFLTYNLRYAEGAQLGIKVLNLDSPKAMENYMISKGTDGQWNTYNISFPKEIARARVSYVLIR